MEKLSNTEAEFKKALLIIKSLYSLNFTSRMAFIHQKLLELHILDVFIKAQKIYSLIYTNSKNKNKKRTNNYSNNNKTRKTNKKIK